MLMMHRKPTYRVYVEEGQRGAMAHVAELSGCFAVGSDASKAVAATPKAIREFLVWLRSHREPLVPEAHVARPSLADISVMEVRNRGTAIAAGSKTTLFSFDTQPWSDEKLERTLRWLQYSRVDLLAAIEGMNDAELKARRISPDRTLWETLWHVANIEYGYIDSIVGPLEKKELINDNEPSHIRERLDTTRELFVRYVRTTPLNRNQDIVQPTWGDHTGELWTLQKAIRQALEHEIRHLKGLR